MLKTLSESLNAYCSSNKSDDVASRIVPLIFPFAQSIGFVLLHGQQLAHSLTDIEKVDEMLKKCVAAGKITILFFRILQQPFQNEEINSNSNLVLILDIFAIVFFYYYSINLCDLNRLNMLFEI